MEIIVKPEQNTLSKSDLEKAIEDFYLPKHLVKAIYDIGHIPPHSQESQVGVGFIDIADYTHLSKFLSPKENQMLLNGLYTAFQMVLERHGGYLNKIEGDSMMFHFDDILDRRLWELSGEDRLTHIARELFYTCVDMQRVCVLFNQANKEFLDETASSDDRQALIEAFSIIKALRNKNDVSSTLYAFFQIRIRIGANIGEVTIGNFGPSGSKQWDIIGLPVINAKRMESTAPVGGLRISADFFNILKKTGIAEEYFIRFKKEAGVLKSVYKDIKSDELYAYREVALTEKKGATYKTYSVQVYPGLPESIRDQSEELLNHGKQGVLAIIEFIRYYRGNHFVIDELEVMLLSKRINLRKSEILKMIHPKLLEQYEKLDTNGGNKSAGRVNRMSLFVILKYMDRYQDLVQLILGKEVDPHFTSYDQHMAKIREHITDIYEKRKKMIIQKTYFFEVVVPLVYSSLESSLLEYQTTLHPRDLLGEEDHSAEASELEEILDLN